MIDVWMIFTMTIPLFEIVGHSYSESLKKELAEEHPKLSATASLPQNSVSVRSPALDQSEHPDRRSEAIILY